MSQRFRKNAPACTCVSTGKGVELRSYPAPGPLRRSGSTSPRRRQPATPGYGKKTRVEKLMSTAHASRKDIAAELRQGSVGQKESSHYLTTAEKEHRRAQRRKEQTHYNPALETNPENIAMAKFIRRAAHNPGQD